ncbi:MAG TPA: 2-oxoglutarate dehydrogenase E1 component, partial [Stellaceae bacterium]|nr:2-oxoglutarate dehydrogenase E1 component [Stellaceae bacterium]
MADIDRTSFLSGNNAGFIAELYARFVEDPQSVDESWRRFFTETADDPAAVQTERQGPPWGRPLPAILDGKDRGEGRAEVRAEQRFAEAADSIRALNLIRAYRVRGHLEADLDPLGLGTARHHPELDYRSWGFTEADLDREIFIDNVLGRERASLREIVALLRRTYCGKIGVE